MAEGRRPAVYTIPPHRAFADAIVAGLMRRTDGDAAALARGTVIVPNNRARRAMQDAFVRASGGGLLLPRLAAIGDVDLGDAAGALFDPVGLGSEPIPPAIDPLARRLILARLVMEADPRLGAAEAVRMAGELARSLDALLIEEVPPARLRDIDVGGLSEHWERALATFRVVLDRWPGELQARGRIELAERRRRLLDCIGDEWRRRPPSGFVCVAGVTSAAPAIARLLRRVSELPQGFVVLPGIDDDPETWKHIDPPQQGGGRKPRAEETHPQYHLKLLLDRMGVALGEVRQWRVATEIDAPPARSRAIASALAPAELTYQWKDLPPAARNLSGVRALEVGTPAEEAQAIALALRQVLETPGRTAALVTPDRALARRVVAACARWGIAVDDSAGRPLSETPPGALLLGIAELAAQRFAPVVLLTVLKHPLVASGLGRPAWLEGARSVDRALRGPRPAADLAGVDEHLAERGGHAADWWKGARACFEPIQREAESGARSLASLCACLREVATALAGDAVWARAEGRAAAELLADIEAQDGEGPTSVEPSELPALLRTLMDEVAVRPPQGGHPRLAIYGLIEARMQPADLMILGGLNEGVWPSAPAPDPWLAPRIRAELGLPGLELRIGQSAHDFATALGAPEVLMTRARRDPRSPTVASRFWLRLRALAGERWPVADDLLAWTRAIDAAETFRPESRPAPQPPAALRPRQVSVTEVDRLKADPYAFYARRMLRLMPLDPVDADATAAWRGTEVHRVLKEWAELDALDPAQLRPRAEAMLATAHPLVRALWSPRLLEAIDWIAERTAALAEEGRRVVAVERQGTIVVDGVELRGTFDRVDRCADGSMAIIDYKTGKAPSSAAVSAGFSLQLGLLGLILERGGFEGLAGKAGTFEYWSLAKDGGSFGKIASPVDPSGKNGRLESDAFVPHAAAHFADAVARFLTGDEPFTAKLHPEYAPYGEYDQLMRLDEWYGRD
jgi:ATP-dependent helicase/nuclease subunit B